MLLGTPAAPPERSEEFLKVALASLDAAHALVAYLDRDLRYVFANRHYGDVVRVPPAELVGRSAESVLGPYYPRVEEHLLGALNGEPRQYEIAFGHEQPRWLRVNVTPDRNADGEVCGLFVFIVDIHELRVAQDSTRRFRYAVEQGVEGFSIHDVDGRFVFANPAEAAIYGYEVEELLGQSWQIQYDEAWCQHIKDKCVPILQRDGRWQGELQGRRKDGTSFPVAVSLTTIRNEAGEPDGLVCTCRDLTDQKLAEASIRHLQKMEAVGKLTGGVAHDFNNLLLVINAEIELALANASNLDNLRECLTNARAASTKAAALTQKLLAFSRKQALQPRVIDANELVYGMAKLLRRTLGKSITVQIHAAPDLWLCRVDPGELENVILNLAINARDAMPDGGNLRIRTSNAVAEGPDPGATIHIEVEDTGAGMDAETLAQVFDPFFTTKAAGSGSGLGLSMAYGFAQQSGGALRARSEVGRGSVFELELPRAEQADLSEEEASDGATELGGITVLLVEDDGPVRHSVARMLADCGAKVVAAEGYQSAESQLRSSVVVELVLSDLMLGDGYTGLEVLARARELRPGVPALLMSGYAAGAAERIESLGVPVLHKPFGPGQLCTAIKNALA